MHLSTVRQHVAALTCSLSVAITATSFVWYAPLLLNIGSPESEVPMTSAQTSWLISSMELGCLFFNIPAGIISNRVGRKYPILFIGPTCGLAFIVLAYTRSLPVLFVLRQIQGLCLALAYVVGPIYIAEVSEPRLRGSTSCHIQTMWFAGCLYDYCVGPYVDYQTYALLCLPIPLLFTATFFFMPESPYYLIMKGRNEEAKQALSWLRGVKEVNEEFKEIEETIGREVYEHGSWKDLFQTKKDRMAFFIVQVCSITKYMGGMPAFANYVSQTFGESTIKYLDHNQLTIVTGVLLTAATFSSCLLSVNFGRRPMLIYSCFCCFLFTFVIGGYFFLDFETAFDVSPYVWVLYVSVIGFIITANVGVGPLLQTVQAEYFTAKTRGIGGALTLVIGSTATFISIKQYQFIQDTVGVYLNYWIWAIVLLFGAICMYFFLPETAGRTLGEIQTDMKNAYQTHL
ncbi:facilitated trehalose transporter Tret1 isoform X2 [Halyomorpha halys]|uniref:facilitated trehalose transporter Tret1 isoform X2 n=1 Tax=Halyomorpha halys TaxID=286706 RepID=UPI0006D4D1C5